MVKIPHKSRTTSMPRLDGPPAEERSPTSEAMESVAKKVDALPLLSQSTPCTKLTYLICNTTGPNGSAIIWNTAETSPKRYNIFLKISWILQRYKVVWTWTSYSNTSGSCKMTWGKERFLHLYWYAISWRSNTFGEQLDGCETRRLSRYSA